MSAVSRLSSQELKSYVKLASRCGLGDRGLVPTRAEPAGHHCAEVRGVVTAAREDARLVVAPHLHGDRVAASVGVTAPRLRKEAAELAGVDVDSLPSGAVISGLVEYIFMLLSEHDVIQGEGLGVRMIKCRKLEEVCRVYDGSIPLEALIETFKTVGGSHGMDHKTLYFWIVLMFCDCGVEGFLCGVDEFAEAAKSTTKFNTLLMHGKVNSI